MVIMQNMPDISPSHLLGLSSNKLVWTHTVSEKMEKCSGRNCQVEPIWGSHVCIYIYIYVHKYPKAWNGSVASQICITCENISQEHHRAGKISAEQLWKNLKVHLAVLLPSLVVSCVKDVLPWVSIDCGKQMQKTTMVFIPRYKGLLSISLQPILAKILRRAKQGTGMDWETCEPQKEMDPNFFRISARAKSIGIHLSMYLSIYVYIYTYSAIYLSIDLSIYLPMCLSTCLVIWLSRWTARTIFRNRKSGHFVAAPPSNHHLQRGRIERSLYTCYVDRIMLKMLKYIIIYICVYMHRLIW